MRVQKRVANRAVKTLNRRRDWLVGRIVQSKKEIPYDRAERLALEICIDVLNALMKGQKVEVSHVSHRGWPNSLGHVAGQTESRASGEVEIEQGNKEQDEVLSGTTHSR